MFDLTLTFDNGPEPGVTPRVLDILRERGIKATFFVIGEKLGDAGRRQLAVRAHDEGHWIGNHTFTHSVPLGEQRDAATAEKEIGRTQAREHLGECRCGRGRCSGSARAIAHRQVEAAASHAE